MCAYTREVDEGKAQNSEEKKNVPDSSLLIQIFVRIIQYYHYPKVESIKIIAAGLLGQNSSTVIWSLPIILIRPSFAGLVYQTCFRISPCSEYVISVECIQKCRVTNKLLI